MTVMYWLLAAAVFLALEIITMGLTTIWFAGGALAAALISMLQLSIGVQIAVFAVVSFILLIITRPIAKRYLNNRTVKTNAESLIGQTCLVTQSVDNLRAEGQVSVKGQIWSARSISDELIIPENTIVRIEGITGVKVIVKPSEETGGN